MFILLTGSEGQVGREIMDLALKKQLSIIGCSKEQLDITQLNQIQKYFQQYPDINIVINAAAYTAVDQAEDEITKAYAVNRDGVKNLALICREKNIPLLHISTDYVFSGDADNGYREADEPGPLSVYGRSKLEGEEILRSIWNKHVILRVSWVFGRYGHNFVKTILKLENITHEELASKVGKNRSTITNILRLLDLPDEIQDHVSRGTLNMGQARTLLSISKYKELSKIVKRIIDENMSVRDIEKIAQDIEQKKSKQKIKKVDANSKDIENKLMEKFSTKIEIKKQKDKGLISFYFYSLDDFNRLYDLFLKI